MFIDGVLSLEVVVVRVELPPVRAERDHALFDGKDFIPRVAQLARPHDEIALTVPPDAIVVPLRMRVGVAFAAGADALGQNLVPGGEAAFLGRSVERDRVLPLTVAPTEEP